MKELLVTYQNEIIVATISFVVALFTSLLTHLLGFSKLRYTEKMKIVSELSKKKYEAISKIRDEILILAQQEDLSVTENKDSLIDQFKENSVYTPACCYSYETLSGLALSLNTLYTKYGCCLRHKTVVLLIYIRNFLWEYTLEYQRYGLSDEVLRWASVPLYEGLMKWYKIFDRELICSMNRPSMKYYAHSGLRYFFLLKIYGIYFTQTKPYKYLRKKDSLYKQVKEYIE